MPISFGFFIRILAKINRRPIDLVKGESKLVFGFNVEYFGIEFALIFIAEYNNFLFYIILFIFRNLLCFRIFIVRLCIIMILLIYMRRLSFM